MAIFGVLDTEPDVQVDDKTRLRAEKSFVSKDEAAITLVEIEPEGSSGFIDVTGSSSEDWYLDWSYSGTSRTVTVSLRITTDGAPVTVTKDMSVVTAADDKLFSTDSQLLRYESDILDLLPAGYSSFNYMHRKVQQLIIDWFDEQGYRLYNRQKITVDQILDVEEVRKWSESWVLALIFNDNSNSVEDKFAEKSRFYDSRAHDSRNRAVFSLDLNDDGQIESGEVIQVDSLRLVRR